MRVLRAFESAGLEYVLIGASAMGFHGLVRATEDLDLFIRATPENIEQVLPKVNGLIVGSYFKKDGAGHKFVDESRVQRFVERFAELRG